MANFLTDLNARLVDDDKIWQLLSPLSYASDIVSTIITVPEGFQTDFASIPRWIPLASSQLVGRCCREACIHDLLYRCDEPVGVTRKQADDIMKEAMLVRGKGWLTAYTVWAGVRIGGGFSYHKRKVEDRLC